MKATFVIFRFDPAVDKQPRYQEYAIDVESTDKILDCLNRIRWELDPTLVYRASCSHGICGSDAMVINGHVGLACQKLVRDYKTANNFVIEPLPLFNVIKDLVVDRSAFDRIIEAGGYISIATGNAPDAHAVAVRKEDSDSAMDAAACIGCGACVAACKNASAMLYVAAKAGQLNTLPQGQPEKTRRTLGMVRQMDLEGFGGCTNQYECEAACPKEISVRWITKLNRDFAAATLKDAFGNGQKRGEGGE